ncbi:hypothetical protein EYB26_008126 [Talaromyces marneffei]|nr:uncharacterized protein EYB26_008126 [Talaromyces marneffei]QGA20424.1 hypothetical protein EYB26_008126 [Talaromyces marneffei]
MNFQISDHRQTPALFSMMSSSPMSKRVKGSAGLNRSSAQQQQQAALSASSLAPPSAYPLTTPTAQTPSQPQPHHHQLQPQSQQQQQQQQQVNPRKRRSPPSATTATAGISAIPGSGVVAPVMSDISGGIVETPPKKKGRTNTPWTAEEEQRLKQMRDLGKSWSEIAKTFPARTEGSVKKHWYKDMHYAEFGEDESVALREAIKEYEANKWKVIGQKIGKPAKACEQYAKEHFKNL